MLINCSVFAINMNLLINHNHFNGGLFKEPEPLQCQTTKVAHSSFTTTNLHRC